MFRIAKLSAFVLVLVAGAGCSAAIEEAKQESLEREAPVPGEEIVADVDEKREGVTLAQFNQLENGMSYAEVSQILGSGGVEISNSDFGEGEFRTVTKMVEWTGNGDFANMNAMFQNDKMISKAQFGLE